MHLCFPQQEPTILSHNNLLTNEPRDMQIMLSRLAVYVRNKHLIVNTSKSEVVHSNSAGENVPIFDVGGATLHHKDFFRYLGMVSTGP